MQAIKGLHSSSLLRGRAALGSRRVAGTGPAPVLGRRGLASTVQPGQAQPVLSKPAAVANSDGATVRLPFPAMTIPESVYVTMEMAVLLAQLALVDAAYSGDWSRIGIISQETELMLQPVVQFIVIAHAFVAALTAREAQAKGVDVPSSILKGFLFGTMELWKVHQTETAADAAPASKAKKAVAAKQPVSAVKGRK